MQEIPKFSALRARIEPELYRALLDTCKRFDLTAAQVLSRYMRKFVKEYHAGIQSELFTDMKDNNRVEK